MRSRLPAKKSPARLTITRGGYTLLPFGSGGNVLGMSGRSAAERISPKAHDSSVDLAGRSSGRLAGRRHNARATARRNQAPLGTQNADFDGLPGRRYFAKRYVHLHIAISHAWVAQLHTVEAALEDAASVR
jgi:hypothetical protein